MKSFIGGLSATIMTISFPLAAFLYDTFFPVMVVSCLVGLVTYLIPDKKK